MLINFYVHLSLDKKIGSCLELILGSYSKLTHKTLKLTNELFVGTASSPAQTSLRSISPSLNTATNLFAQNSRQQHHNSSSSLGNTTPTSAPPQQVS